MSTITINPTSPGHLSDIYAIIHETDPAFFNKYLSYIPDLADVKKHTFDDPDFNPDLFLSAFIDNQLIGCVQGIQRLWKKGKEDYGFVKWILVKKAYRNRGVGTKLLTTLEKALIHNKAKTLMYGSCSPVYLWAGVPAEDPATAALFKRCNWQRDTDRVSILTEPEKSGITQTTLDLLMENHRNIKLTIAGSEEEQKTANFIAKYFSPSWAREVSPCFKPDTGAFCSVLYHNNDIVGFCPIGASNPHWLGPMGTHPDYRGRGYGKIVFIHSMLHAKKIKLKHVLINWINGKELFYGPLLADKTMLTYYSYKKT